MNARTAPFHLAVATIALVTTAFSAQAVAQATFYEQAAYSGRSMTATEHVRNLQRQGMDRAAESVVVANGKRWEVCDELRFRGNCMVLRPGRYPTPASMGLNEQRIVSARALPHDERIADNRYAPEPVPAQLTFYARENFRGRTYTTETNVPNLKRTGFNDRAESAVVLGERWEICDNAQFRGRCVVLRPGRYPSLAAMGLGGEVTSLREVAWDARVAHNRYAPEPVPVYDSRRRRGERFFEADITSARVVLATPGQRCWVEQEQLPQVRGDHNVPAAIAGALIGGILGHQVGGGSGKDIATVGGVVAGAALGAQYGRNGQPATQDVQRCENLPGGAQPAYWDVSYEFRGRQHRIQMAEAPGNTITVNDRGEPRQ
jgi:uncharacterized protein YcfJ